MLHLKVLAALIATPLAATPPMPAIPLLSMTVVTGSAATPYPGDRITYTVTVANRDRLPLAMTIRLVSPRALDGLTALDGGQRNGRVLTWPASIEPQQRASVRFSGVPVTDGRVSVTACAYLDQASRPTACASDVTTVALPPPATAGQIAGRFAAFFGTLLVLVVGWRWWRYRRGVRPAHVAEVIAAAKAVTPVAVVPVTRREGAHPPVDAGRALTVTDEVQAATPRTSSAPGGAETAASGTPMR